MTTAAQGPVDRTLGATGFRAKEYEYDKWMEAQGVPIYRGFYIEDLRTIALGDWKLRGIKTAFVQLMGMEGINELRVTELGPGETTAPFKFALDELVYVLDGGGLTTVWSDDGPKKTFEWQTHSMFLLPRHFTHQLSNTHGDRTVRLMHYNYLPVAMAAIQESDFFFNNPYKSAPKPTDDLFKEAKAVTDPTGLQGGPLHLWYGNFFPDMAAWDKLQPYWRRGGGTRNVFFRFPDSGCSAHMAVFPSRIYKKAHRHGPGRAIVIPGGEGFSILWPNEGAEKVVCPWHEGSLLTPPGRWFHQHFNVGSGTGRYLALHPLPQFSGHSERVEDRARDQIEYPNEEPWIRQKFEEQLGKRGLESLMPAEAYKDPDYTWDYT